MCCKYDYGSLIVSWTEAQRLRTTRVPRELHCRSAQPWFENLGGTETSTVRSLLIEDFNWTVPVMQTVHEHGQR